MDSKALLAAVRAAQGIPSNYRLARVLGVPDNTVQRWNTGSNTPDDLMAARLAQLADLDPGSVVAAMHAQRAAAPEERALWERISERLAATASTAAAVILSALLGVTFTPDAGAMAHSSAPMASGSPTMPTPAAGGVLYIVHSSRRAFLRFLAWLFRPICHAAA